MTDNLYRAKVLPNGLIRVEEKVSELTGLYNADGTFRDGDLRLSRLTVKYLTGIDPTFWVALDRN